MSADLRQMVQALAAMTPEDRDAVLGALPEETQRELADLLEKQLAMEPLDAFIRRVAPHEPPPPHLQPIIEAFERARWGQVRVCFSMPPRHGKSVTLMRAIAWWLLNYPRDQCAYYTYSDTKADSKSRTIRALVQSQGAKLSGDQANLRHWKLDTEGGLMTGGRGGGATGEGVSGIFVVDDPFKNRAEADSEAIREQVWEWFTQVAFTRKEGASYIVVHTRWHDDDLIGRLAGEHGWEYVNLPAEAEKDDPLRREVGEALWEERIPLSELKETRATIGEWAYAALYQGQPRPRGGAVFSGEPARFDLRTFDWMGRRGVIAVDPAATASNRADHSVALVAAMDGYGLKSRMFIVDLWRGQVEIPDLVQRLADLQRRYKLLVAAEAVAGFKAVPQTLRRTSEGLRILEITPPTDKFIRAQSVGAAWTGVPAKNIPGGRVLVPIDADWADAYIRELQKFTGMGDAEDDQVDATAHAWNTLYREAQPGAHRGSYEAPGV
jgi:predicted phage terminase large subunit-like protein